MRATKKTAMMLATLAAAMLFHASAVMAQQSICGTMDISQLLATAEKSFNLAEQDAVILFDGLKIRWLPDGRLVNDVHRIIWINNSVVRRRYGDHRIPYDKAHCVFNDVTVRTWRDGRWWQSGPTGIVETLPHALRTAYDYTNMREMMLLHDGIELPCILEIAYSIEDQKPFRSGHDGLWTFARPEPVVQARFTLGLPTGWTPHVFTPDGVTEPEKNVDEERGLDIYRWQMGPLPAIPRPPTADPASHVPHIIWSTWENWNTYGKHLQETFDSAINSDGILAECLDSLMEDARTEREKANLIAGFINERTRFIDYPETYWWSTPRPATRTYETAYGHRLDRAILAAAMFSEAGLEVHPAFRGSGYGNINNGIPSLSRLTGIGVRVYGNDLDAWYNPADGTISHGPVWANLRTTWRPGVDPEPLVNQTGNTNNGSLEIGINLSFDKEKDVFAGHGYLSAADGLSPYSQMVGLANEAKTYLGRVASGMISGMEVTDYNPDVFTPAKVTFGYGLELPKPEPDDYDRLPLVLGQPAGGIFDHLPDDVALYHQKRSSPIYVPGPMAQQVQFRLDTKGWEVIHLPRDNNLHNEAGSFSVTVDHGEDRIIITQKLNLAKPMYTPDEWPALRALLLTASHEKSQTLLLKQLTDEDEIKGEGHRDKPLDE